MFIEQSARAQTVNCRNIWARFAAITRPLSRLRSATRNALRLGHQRPPNWKLSPGNCRRCDKLHDIKGSRQEKRYGLAQYIYHRQDQALCLSAESNGWRWRAKTNNGIDYSNNRKREEEEKKEEGISRGQDHSKFSYNISLERLLLDSSRMQFLK